MKQATLIALARVNVHSDGTARMHVVQMKHFSQSVMLVVAFQPNKPSLDLFQYYVIYISTGRKVSVRG